MAVNKEIRKTILKMVNKDKATHIASAFSLVEILNSIYKSVDVQKIINQDRGRRILSKGYEASGLYAVMFHHGLLSKKACYTNLFSISPNESYDEVMGDSNFLEDSHGLSVRKLINESLI